MKTDSIHGRLAHYVVSAFNPDTMRIECGTGNIPVTRDTVHEALGLPMGEHQLQFLPFRGNEDWYDEWSAQFNKSLSQLLPSYILSAIIRRPFADMVFKANFILLLCSTLGNANKMGACTCGVMPFIRDSMNFREVDWCTYILSFVRRNRETWFPKNHKSMFQGPATLLTLLYVDYVECSDLFVERARPIINGWTFDLLKFRENAEIDAGGFGQGSFLGRDLDDDSDENFEDNGSDEDEESDEDEDSDEV